MKPILVIVVCLLAGPAYAQPQFDFGSSPNPVGSGARALGKASAFVAVADDATAASWNPGGLIALERPEVSFVFSFKDRSEQFGGYGLTDDEARQRTSYGDANYFSAAYPFKVGSRFFVASINYQALIDFNKDISRVLYSSSSNLRDQTHVNYRQSGAMRAITPALAFQLSPQIAAGVALTLWTDKLGFENGWRQIEELDRTTVVMGVPFAQQIVLHQRFDHQGVGCNFGLLWDIDPRLTLGVVAKTPVWGSLTRTIEKYTENGTDIVVGAESYEEAFRLPPSWGVGVSYRHSDRLTVSGDVYRTEWGLFSHAKTDLASEETTEINPIAAMPYDEAEVAGTTQAHLGVEYLLIFPRTVVPLRGGLFYDPEPGVEQAHFIGVAAGTGISVGDLIIDAAYQGRFSVGEVPDVIVTSGQDASTSTLGAGGGNIWQHLFYLSTIYHF